MLPTDSKFTGLRVIENHGQSIFLNQSGQGSWGCVALALLTRGDDLAPEAPPPELTRWCLLGTLAPSQLPAAALDTQLTRAGF